MNETLKCFHDKTLIFLGVQKNGLNGFTLWNCSECGSTVTLDSVEKTVLVKNNLNPYPATAESLSAAEFQERILNYEEAL